MSLADSTRSLAAPREHGQPGDRELPQGPTSPYVRPYTRATATYVLVGTCVAMFVLQVMLGNSLPGQLFNALFVLEARAFLAGWVWQPITHIFLHANTMHLLFNMLALGSIGPWVERLIGRGNFILVFLLGGIIGGLAQIYVSPQYGVLGASGGVFAVMLALTTMKPNAQLSLLLFFVLPIRLKGRTLGISLILSSVLLHFVDHVTGVGHMSHLGGALAGWGYASLLRDHRERHYRGRPLPRWEYEDDLEAPPGFEGQPGPSLHPRGEPRSVFPTSRPIARPLAPVEAPVRPLRRPAGSSSQVDALLDKVEREGIDSLTPAEKRLLERGLK